MIFWKYTKREQEVGGMDVEKIRKNLVEARGEKTQSKVAKDLGLSVSSLSMYESGERVPRDEIKERMARYYGKTVGALFFGE